MVNGGKINCGSCVYVNGISLTVVSFVLVVVRRNGFRPSNISTGDVVKHCGTTVVMDKAGLVIKGGKPVHVMNLPERYSQPRYTVNPRNAENAVQFIGTNTMTGAMRAMLSNWSFLRINSRLTFLPNGSSGYSVCCCRTSEPIGLDA